MNITCPLLEYLVLTHPPQSLSQKLVTTGVLTPPPRVSLSDFVLNKKLHNHKRALHARKVGFALNCAKIEIAYDIVGRVHTF